MKVILKNSKEVKEVSFGHAVNYLIPQGLAVVATPQELNKLAQGEQQQEKKVKEKVKENKSLAAKLEGQKIVLKAKSSSGDNIFGSITDKHILNALNVDPKKVEVLQDKPIKKLGSYKVKLKVGSQEVEVTVKVTEDKKED